MLVGILQDLPSTIQRQMMTKIQLRVSDRAVKHQKDVGFLNYFIVTGH